MEPTLGKIIEALNVEAERHHEVYRDLSRRADAEGLARAGRLLRVIVSAEKARVGLYLSCFQHRDPETCLEEYFVCPNCGFTISDEPPGRCPLCDAGSADFVRVE